MFAWSCYYANSMPVLCLGLIANVYKPVSNTVTRPRIPGGIRHVFIASNNEYQVAVLHCPFSGRSESRDHYVRMEDVGNTAIIAQGLRLTSGLEIFSACDNGKHH